MNNNIYQSRIELFYNQLDFLNKPLMIIISSLLLGLISQIAIPMPSGIPLTLQPIAVIAMGMIMGSRLATYAILAYFIEGGLGLPVFAFGQSGWTIFLGLKAGFLIGFIPAACIGGYLMKKGFAQTFFGTITSGMAALSVLYVCGIANLWFSLGFQQALVIGLLPYLPFIPVKLGLLGSTKWAWQDNRDC